jgi:broad specificity phosphatase PhoE
LSRIHLVRHGRSAHVHAGWIDLAGFHRWRESYEAAAIAEGEWPPDSLKALAANAVVVASDAPRAIASARLLREDVLVSPLLRELELHPPNLRGVKLPLALWALTFAVKWLFRGSHATPEEEARAREAAAWLEGLDGPVVAVTHQTFRSLLAKALIARGWRSDKRPRSQHWSVWSLHYNAAPHDLPPEAEGHLRGAAEVGRRAG